MGLITSTKTSPDNPTGLLDEATPGLVFDWDVIDNAREKTLVLEYRLHGELVHRSVHMKLKKPGVEATGVAANVR